MSGKCDSTNVEAQPDHAHQVSEPNENDEELQEYQSFISENEDCGPAAFNRSEGWNDEDEATVTTKFLNDNTKVFIIPETVASIPQQVSLT